MRCTGSNCPEQFLRSWEIEFSCIINVFRFGGLVLSRRATTNFGLRVMIILDIMETETNNVRDIKLIDIKLPSK